MKKFKATALLLSAFLLAQTVFTPIGWTGGITASAIGGQTFDIMDMRAAAISTAQGNNETAIPAVYSSPWSAQISPAGTDFADMQNMDIRIGYGTAQNPEMARYHYSYGGYNYDDFFIERLPAPIPVLRPTIGGMAAAIAFTAPKTGVYTVSGHQSQATIALHPDTLAWYSSAGLNPATDVVEVRITLNGEKIWPQGTDSVSLSVNFSSITFPSLQGLNLNKNDKLRFEVKNIALVAGWLNRVLFYPQIELTQSSEYSETYNSLSLRESLTSQVFYKYNADAPVTQKAGGNWFAQFAEADGRFHNYTSAIMRNSGGSSAATSCFFRGEVGEVGFLNEWVFGGSEWYVTNVPCISAGVSPSKSAIAFRADSGGVYTIRPDAKFGEVIQWELSQNDSTRFSITKNGKRIWPAAGPMIITANTNRQPFPVIEDILLAEGDVLRFEIQSTSPSQVFMWPVVEMTDEPYRMMDLNGDGEITVVDLILAKKHTVNQQGTFNLFAADTDSSGTVDAADLIKIRKTLLGIYDFSSMDVWVSDALTDVFQYTLIPEDGRQDVELHLAKNEREGVSVAFNNHEGMAGDVEIDVLPFSQPGAPVIESYVTRYAFATRNSDYIQAGYKRFHGETLVPSYYVPGRLIEGINPYDNGYFWLETVTTAATVPGTYTTTAILSCEKGQMEIPVSVTVYNVTIPDPADSDFSYSCWGDRGTLTGSNYSTMYNEMFGFDYKDDEYWEFQKNSAIAQKNERQNVCVIPLSILGDGLTIDVLGNYTFDFTLFNKYVNTYLENGSYKYLCGSHLLDKDWYLTPGVEFPTHATVAWIFSKYYDGSIVTRWAFTDSPEAQKHLRQLLTALNQNLIAQGWEDMWIQHVCDEASGAKPIQEIRDTYDLVHQLIPTAKTVDAGTDLYSRYGSKLNFPTPQLDNYDSMRTEYRNANQNDPNVDVWFYTCTNPQSRFMSRLDDFPLLSTRALGWYAYKENVKGYLHWAWNLWYANPDPLGNIDHPGGPLDAWLVFPDIEGLSVFEGPRSIAMRDGIEDRELLALAAGVNSQAVSSAVNQLVQSGSQFNRNPQNYLAARKTFLLLASGQ